MGLKDLHFIKLSSKFWSLWFSDQNLLKCNPAKHPWYWSPMIRLDMCPCHFIVQIIFLTNIIWILYLLLPWILFLGQHLTSIYQPIRFPSLYLSSLYSYLLCKGKVSVCVCVCVCVNGKVGVHNIIVLLEILFPPKINQRDIFGSAILMETQ